MHITFYYSKCIIINVYTIQHPNVYITLSKRNHLMDVDIPYQTNECSFKFSLLKQAKLSTSILCGKYKNLSVCGKST